MIIFGMEVVKYIFTRLLSSFCLILILVAKRFPLGQMPTLQVDDKVVCQTKAINGFVNSFIFEFFIV